MAAQYDRTDIIKVLIDAGAAVDAAAEDGCTPLIIASEVGAVASVSALLERGADITRADNNGATPRSIAKDPQIIEMLDHASQ
jgi:hypothetical protein